MDRSLLFAELIRDEGLRLRPYYDEARKLTIGVGRNLDANGITRDEAMVLLDTDITRQVVLLNKYCPWWSELDEVRQRALVNMAFNLGVGPSEEQPTGKLLSFEQSLMLMRRGMWADVGPQLRRSRWAEQVKGRADRIIAMLGSGQVA